MTTVRPESLSRRVSRGARLLDSRFPGWWQHVNTRTLDTASTRDCILGQLVRFRVIIPVRPIDTFADMLCEAIGSEVHADGVRHGFDAPLTPRYFKSCAALDAYWRQEINQRATHSHSGHRATGA